MCIRCHTPKPETEYFWQKGRHDTRVRDKTCKACRAEQKRERDRTAPTSGADPIIARFLALPRAHC